ncbi:MAG: FUSC family protein [Lachnospiraceae bacterium]|nr:FUSC family protein [Lachnospiraceae bacterium]
MDKLKALRSELPGKALVFLFCVLFISFYKNIFGVENNIIAVVLLTGLFIFMRGDLGYQAKQAAPCIVLMFFLMVTGAKAALLNPFLGIIVNFVVIGLILVLSSHNLAGGNHVPFLMGYIFCQGYDVSGSAYGMRFLSVMLASLVIAAIYYFANRKREYSRSVRDLFQEMDIHSIRTQWYLRMAVTLTLVLFICEFIHYPRTMWVALAVLSLTTPFEEDQKARSRVRIPAAILGTALFYVLFVMLIPEQYQTIVVMIAGFMAMFIQNYFIKSIYNSFSSLGAAVILFPTTDALFLRVISNIIGTAAAVVSYFVFNVIFSRLDTAQQQQ